MRSLLRRSLHQKRLTLDDEIAHHFVGSLLFEQDYTVDQRRLCMMLAIPSCDAMFLLLFSAHAVAKALADACNWFAAPHELQLDRCRTVVAHGCCFLGSCSHLCSTLDQ
jgi:hypothetical protein